MLRLLASRAARAAPAVALGVAGVACAAQQQQQQAACAGTDKPWEDVGKSWADAWQKTVRTFQQESGNIERALRVETDRALRGIQGLRNITVLDSAALTALFTVIRDKNTDRATYNIFSDRICRILAEEGLARVRGVVAKTVETPCGTYDGLQYLATDDMCAVSIVRSGDILLEGVRQIATGIPTGKILVQRDESDPEKRTKLFYSKLPHNIAKKQVILCDPMCATGGSVKHCIRVLLDAGVKEENILFLNIVSVPEGLWSLAKAYPKVRVVTCAIDVGLNEDKFISPGLGDFGDRYYGTED